MKKISYLFLILLPILFSNCTKTDLTDKTSLPEVSPDFTSVNALLANDPFAPYLTNIPTVTQTISTTNSGSGSSAITIKRLKLSSKGGANIVFAILAYPQGSGTHPAIMFNHGGGGNAESQLGNVQTYAAMGYVTMAIDLPGIAGTSNTPNSSGAWKSAAAGEGPRLNVSGGPQNSTLFDAGVAGLQAFNYLRSQANVDLNNMAISGTSWGGYMTTFLSGILGNRVKAAYSSFGCGYYDLGSSWSGMIAALSAADRTTWLTYLDAGRRAPGMTAAYFIEEPSNDTYFWPEAVAGTLNAIPGTKNHVVMPNLNHQWIPAATAMKKIYMDYYLKGTGSPFGSISISGTVPQSDGSLQVNMTVNIAGGTSVSTVQLYYSVPTANWQTRNWLAINATHVSGNAYRATLSASQVSQHVNYFGNYVDSRTVTTSTIIYQAASSGGGGSIANGTYKIINLKSGLALDAKGNLTANGTLIEQWGYSGGNNQKWTVTSIGGGQYKIIGVASGRSLDVTGNTTADGAAIQLYDYHNGGGQNWVFTATSGGYYTIKSAGTGKVLDVTGNSTAAGALIQQWSSSGGTNQQWAFQAP